MTMSEESLFHRALEKPAGERAAFLDQACAGDAALRQHIEALLRAHDNPGSFLARPPLDAGATGPPPPVPPADEEGPGRLSGDAPGARPVSEGPGSRIGPYKLLQQIGEGGMGAVFLAEQTEPVRRRVAVKVIKPGMDTAQVVARFEAERQALALMDHPHIAKVLDAGTTHSGRPYFVMELVKGVPLTRYCDERRLTPRERLELFLPVCQAVQHAHQKGVIHRDLKPSNVLVALYDGRPVPKVIDFGVAKATGPRLTERTLFTGFGAIVGTLEYMSPEQAELNQLDIDTRSDIYALGVLLYELLTGTTPLERKRVREAGLLEVLRLIREEETQRPSTRLSTAEDLPAIAAGRGVEPKKLSRLLRGELDWIVMKCLEKERGRRYETANGLARDIERYLHDEPVQACPPSAAYRFRKFVRRHKTGLAIAGLILSFLVLLGGGVGWAVRDWAAREAVREQEISRALEEAETSYQGDKLPEAVAAVKRAEGLLAGGGGSQTLRRRVRRWRTDLGMVVQLEEIPLERAATAQEGGFDAAGADRAYREAFRQYGLDVEALDPDEAARRIRASAVKDRLVVALGDWVLVRWMTLALRSRIQPLLTIAQRADADPDRDRVRKALQRGTWEGLKGLVRDEKVLGQPATVVLLGSVLPQVGQPRLAIDILRKAQRRHPGNFWINHDLGVLLLPTQPGEAVGFLRVALALRPQSPAVHVSLGNGLYAHRQYSEAEAEYREAVRLKPDFQVAHRLLGGALVAQRKFGAAEAEYRTAIRLDPKSFWDHYYLGRVRLAAGNREGAIAAFRRAVALNPKLAPGHDELGIALLAKGDGKGAIAAFRRAIAADPKYAPPHYNLGTALWDADNRDGALAAFRQAVALDPKHARAHNNLGLALRAKGDVNGAITAYRRAIAANPNLAHAHNNLGLALQAKRDGEGAIAAFRRAIACDPQYASPHYHLGNALRARGDMDGAIASYRKAIRRKLPHPGAYYNLGAALESQGKSAEAIAAFQGAIGIQPGYSLSHIRLAWLLTTCPEPKLRDPKRALEAARKAVQLAPQSPWAWQALGWAQYRAGDWKASVKALEKAIALQKAPQGGGPGQWFFLAMAHWQLGNKDEARNWYRQAVQWMEKHDPRNEQLRRFRVEATQLLGWKGKTD
jgi:tetratricopeptide (TPR) repeat protein